MTVPLRMLYKVLFNSNCCFQTYRCVIRKGKFFAYLHTSHTATISSRTNANGGGYEDNNLKTFADIKLPVVNLTATAYIIPSAVNRFVAGCVVYWLFYELFCILVY